MENKNQDAGWWMQDEQEERVSDFYKWKVGPNVIRLLTPFEKVCQLSEGTYPNAKLKGMVDETYQPGEGETVTKQGWCWGIDRASGEIKLFVFGSQLRTHLTTLARNPDYAFKAFPMPYDITVNNTGSGPARYSIQGARQNTEVTQAEMEKLNKKKKISDIIALIKEKGQKKNEAPTPAIEYPTGESEGINPEAIPF